MNSKIKEKTVCIVDCAIFLSSRNISVENLNLLKRF